MISKAINIIALSSKYNFNLYKYNIFNDCNINHEQINSYLNKYQEEILEYQLQINSDNNVLVERIINNIHKTFSREELEGELYYHLFINTIELLSKMELISYDYETNLCLKASVILKAILFKIELLFIIKSKQKYLLQLNEIITTINLDNNLLTSL